jgi:hypothetical protein
MNATNVRVQKGFDRLSTRKAECFRQAIARRRLQELREEKLLQGRLTEVWDESPSRIEYDSSIHLY